MMAMIVLGGFLAAFPNPVSPNQYLVLSEVQVIDPSHWTVEFLYANKFHTVALLSDTFTYDYSLVNKNIDTSIHPKIPVKQNGYGFITPQQYPTLRLHPGDTVKLLWNHFGMSPWECVIDSNLKPTQSMAAYQWCNPMYYPGPNVSYVEWCKDASPTIGYANDSVGIWGCLKGFVCDKDSNPIPNFQLEYYDPLPGIHNNFVTYINTDGNGCFFFSNLVSAYKFTFSSWYPAPYVGSFGPFSVEPGCTLNVTLKLDKNVFVHDAAGNVRPPFFKILNISKQQQSNSILIVFNGNRSKDDFTLSVFTVGGKRLYTSQIPNNGSGTYTTGWKNCAHSGTYIARISTQSASVERRFTIK
jgi:hypothetical protein